MKRLSLSVAALALVAAALGACAMSGSGDGGQSAAPSSPVTATPSQAGPARREGEGTTPGRPALASGGSLMLPPARSEAPVGRRLAVMIENQAAARPQSGLLRADVVYEAPAEGGITRFLAIYGSEDVKKLGPVRSARDYFVSWARPFGAVYVHAGGSPRALSWLRQMEMPSVDALRTGGRAFERSRDRKAPHNLYVDTGELRRYVARKARLQVGSGSWGGLRFEGAPTVGTAPARRLQLTYPSGYSVEYRYNPATGRYRRLMEGEPHLDRETRQPLAASAVVVQAVKMWPARGDHKGRLQAQLQGEGRLLVFQNGAVIRGRWERANREAPTQYLTEAGEPITLKPGQVWVQELPSKGSVLTYKATSQD